jgi:hypothetical protein
MEYEYITEKTSSDEMNPVMKALSGTSDSTTTPVSIFQKIKKFPKKFKFNSFMKIFVVVLCVIFILYLYAVYTKRYNTTYDKKEITSFCKNALNNYCTKGKTLFNAQVVDVGKTMYGGDIKQCTEESKLFDERPLQCQPHNHSALCNKIIDIQEKNEIEPTITYGECMNHGNAVLTPAMAQCLDKNFKTVDGLKSCLQHEKTMTWVNPKEVFPTNIKW